MVLRGAPGRSSEAFSSFTRPANSAAGRAAATGPAYGRAAAGWATAAGALKRYTGTPGRAGTGSTGTSGMRTGRGRTGTALGRWTTWAGRAPGRAMTRPGVMTWAEAGMVR